MARNHKFFFDKDGSPRARGPAAEKTLMTFLEVDVQGSDHICRDLMDDLTAIEDGSDDSREFIGNAHQVLITPEGVTITPTEARIPDPDPIPGTGSADGVTAKADGTAGSSGYRVALKHFREVLEDWEAFILDDLLDDPLAEDDYQ
jgi:hypothetical protein